MLIGKSRLIFDRIVHRFAQPTLTLSTRFSRRVTIEIVDRLQCIADDAKFVQMRFFNVVIVQNREVTLLKNLVATFVYQLVVIELGLTTSYMSVPALWAGDLEILNVDFIVSDGDKISAFRIQALEAAENDISHSLNAVRA